MRFKVTQKIIRTIEVEAPSMDDLRNDYDAYLDVRSADEWTVITNNPEHLSIEYVEEPIVTKTGKNLTEEDIAKFADEAERGYEFAYGGIPVHNRYSFVDKSKYETHMDGTELGRQGF